MDRRQLLLAVGAAWVRTAAAQDIKLTLADVTVGEYSTSMRLPDKFAFISGMPIYLSFRVGGLRVESELEMVSFDYTVEAVDGLGNLFEKPLTGRVTRRVSSDVTALPPLVRLMVKVPDFVYPATGKFRIRVTDRYGKQTAETEAEIPIRSGLPKPSGIFEILEHRLYRGEYDDAPVKEAVFRPGDTIWTRFVLAGFQWKGREYDLRYGLQVSGRDGRVVLSAADVVAERNSSEYLKAYVTAMASIRMEGTARPGDYSLVVHATDAVANTTAKSTVTFRLTTA